MVENMGHNTTADTPKNGTSDDSTSENSASKNSTVTRIVIIGGGSAGWLTAGVIAAHHGEQVHVTLIESANIKTIGVGEGTWPTMRDTLQKIGITETDFMRSCDASFKQGSQFINWGSSQMPDNYYHPFSLPAGYIQGHSAHVPRSSDLSFAHMLCPQATWCDAKLAPKLGSDKEFTGQGNYGYHLDADKFAKLLKKHCTEQLHVAHIVDEVIEVIGQCTDNIKAVITTTHGNVEGDLFIDCSGGAALLIDKHYKVPWLSQQQVLKNDSAVAVQVPHKSSECDINSCTLSTAQTEGWIWDIALPTRRGIGYTFASEFTDEHIAKAALLNYIKKQGLSKPDAEAIRTIKFNPGFRQTLWYKNCVAVGMSAGFLEPLEASALVMIELSAAYIAENLPQNPVHMETVAARFNREFSHHWQSAVAFLKLHYVLSNRADSEYWQTMRSQGISKNLSELLALWRYQAPKHQDLPHSNDIFSVASYQYILYGMGFDTAITQPILSMQSETLFKDIQLSVNRFAEQGKQTLPKNRALLLNIKNHGIPKI
ncbi:tryptophan halogenase family protein [Pseudoalteromonas citrea]|nr:tryptophan halogenase family protein [Pseudoalteromonas citrea]